METDVRAAQRGELSLHPLSDPTAAGICPEMLGVAEEACRAGDFDLAAEIYGSQLADLHQPDRGLWLRRADSLARAGRVSEALDAYCFAASLCRLRPEELPFLVETIARTLREKELGGVSGRGSGSHEEDVDGAGEPLDLFSCRLCRCLLYEPTTVECGHTFCRRCLEENPAQACVGCRQSLNKSDAVPHGRRPNVVLSGLLDKLFGSESKGRKFWVEGEALWKKQNLPAALEKLDAAADLGKRRLFYACLCSTSGVCF